MGCNYLVLLGVLNAKEVDGLCSSNHHIKWATSTAVKEMLTHTRVDNATHGKQEKKNEVGKDTEGNIWFHNIIKNSSKTNFFLMFIYI